MASRSDILAGRAFVELTLKNGLTNGLLKARQQLQQFASAVRRTARALTTIGTAMTAPFLAAVYKVDEVRKKLGEITDTLGQALAPAIMPILDNTLKIVQGFAQWAKNNEKTVTTVLRIGLGMVAVGVAFKAAAAAATLFSLSLSAAAAVSGFIASSSILAPILGIGAALAVAAAAWMRWTDSGREAFQSLSSWGGQLLGIVRDTVSGVVDALMAGDLGLAAKVASAGLSLAFNEAKLSILSRWVEIKIAALAALDEIRVAAAGPVAFMSSLWESFADYSRGIFASLGSVATAFWSGFQTAGSAAFQALIGVAGQFFQIAKTILHVIGVGFQEIVNRAAAIAKVAPQVINVGIEKITGFNVGSAINKAGQAAAGARDQARQDASGRQLDRRVGGSQAIAAQQAAIEADKRRLEELRKQASQARNGLDFTSLNRMASAAASSAGGALALSGSQTGSGGNLQQRILRASEKNVAASDATKSELAEVKTELTNIKTLLATL